MIFETFDELIIEYKNCIKVTSTTNYRDKNSVKKSNKAINVCNHFRFHYYANPVFYGEVINKR